VIQHFQHHQKEINKLKAQNRKEDKAIEEVSDNIEEFSENMDDVLDALEKAQQVLKRRKKN
jgi:prefoldin subunit 5